MHVEDRKFSRDKHRKYFPKSETTPWGWHGIKQPSGKHNTINILLTRGFRVMWSLSAIERISIDTSFPVRLWKLRFDSVKIMLFACRRSMIWLNRNIMMLKKVIAVKILKVDEPKKHTEGLLVKISSVVLSTGR